MKLRPAPTSQTTSKVGLGSHGLAEPPQHPLMTVISACGENGRKDPDNEQDIDYVSSWRAKMRRHHDLIPRQRRTPRIISDLKSRHRPAWVQRIEYRPHETGTICPETADELRKQVGPGVTDPKDSCYRPPGADLTKGRRHELANGQASNSQVSAALLDLAQTWGVEPSVHTKTGENIARCKVPVEGPLQLYGSAATVLPFLPLSTDHDGENNNVDVKSDATRLSLGDVSDGLSLNLHLSPHVGYYSQYHPDNEAEVRSSEGDTRGLRDEDKFAIKGLARAVAKLHSDRDAAGRSTSTAVIWEGSLEACGKAAEDAFMSTARKGYPAISDDSIAFSKPGDRAD